MNWLASVAIGVLIAWLIVYFIDRVTPPPVVETFVQQPIREMAPISDENAMLVAVGLQAPKKSVMDASEISMDEWQARHKAMLGAVPAPPNPMEPKAGTVPDGGGVGWTGGAMASGRGASDVVTQTFIIGGSPAAAGGQAPGPRALTTEELRRASFEKWARDKQIEADTEAEAAYAREITAGITTADKDYKTKYLGTTKKDNDANRMAYVTGLISGIATEKAKYAKDSYDDWVAKYGVPTGDNLKIYRDSVTAKNKEFEMRSAVAEAMKTGWALQAPKWDTKPAVKVCASGSVLNATTQKCDSFKAKEKNGSCANGYTATSTGNCVKSVEGVLGCPYIGYTLSGSDCSGPMATSSTPASSALTLNDYTKQPIGGDWPGGDISNLPSNDPTACAAKCTSQPDCVAFAVSTDSQACWTKKALNPANYVVAKNRQYYSKPI